MADEYFALKAQLVWQYTLEIFRAKAHGRQGLEVQFRQLREYFEEVALPAVSNMIDYNRPKR